MEKNEKYFSSGELAILLKLENSTEFIKQYYGFFKYFNVYFKKRYEQLEPILFRSKYDRMILLRMYRTFLPKYKTFSDRFDTNLYFLYMKKNYKAWRHIRGLPVRGHRTWSNGNTPQRVNVRLKTLVAIKSWTIYDTLTKTYALTAILAEYANSMWRHNWYYEWREARSQMRKSKKKFSLRKVDLYAMSQFHIKVNMEKKILSKKARRKKKAEVQNIFTTGFYNNFTKLLVVKSAHDLRKRNLQLLYTKTVAIKIRKKKKKIMFEKGVKSVQVARKKRMKRKKSIWD